MRLSRSLFVVAALLLIGSIAQAQAQKPLPPPKTWTVVYMAADSQWLAVNSQGTVVGRCIDGAIVARPTTGYAKEFLRLTLSSADYAVWDLRTAECINDSYEQIAGTAKLLKAGVWTDVGYRYTPVAGSTPIVEEIPATYFKPLSDGTMPYVVPAAITEFGDAIGTCGNGGDTSYADVVLFSGNPGYGQNRVLLSGNYGTWNDIDINDRLVVCGTTKPSGGWKRKAYRYTVATKSLEIFTPLATLKGSTPDDESMALTINNDGTWGGYALALQSNKVNYHHACTYTYSPLIKYDLHKGIALNKSSKIRSLNNQNIAVGHLWDSSSISEGFVCPGNDYMYTLNEVSNIGPGSYDPTCVSDTNIIVGRYRIAGQNYFAGFIMLPN